MPTEPKAKPTPKAAPRAKAVPPQPKKPAVPPSIAPRQDAPPAAVAAIETPQPHKTPVTAAGITHYHACFELDHALANWLRADWLIAAQCVKRPDGRDFTWRELKAQAYEAHTVDGDRCIALEPCPAFDPAAGCPGHAMGGAE